MHRIDTENNVNGQFTDNFGGTQEGTVIGEDWLTTLQEEVISVLTLAGIELDKASNTQLAEAISVLVTAVMNNHAALPDAHAAPSTGFQITGNGVDYQLIGGNTRVLQYMYVSIPAGKKLRLKRCRYHLVNSDFKLQIECIAEDGFASTIDGPWTSATWKCGDEAPGFILYDNTAGGISSGIRLQMAVVASDIGEILSSMASWWLDLAIE